MLHVSNAGACSLDLVDLNHAASQWHTTLTPRLSGVLILGGAELTSSLCLLLQGLLLLSVGIANLDLQLFAIVDDGVVIVRLDHLFTSITILESKCVSELDRLKLG